MEIRGSVEMTELVKRLLPIYEDHIDDAPKGKRYQDCHNLATGKPCQEYVDLYGQVKTELAGMGLKFKK